MPFVNNVIHFCKNTPCGERCKSTYCSACDTKAKRDEQIELNKKIVEERNLINN